MIYWLSRKHLLSRQRKEVRGKLTYLGWSERTTLLNPVFFGHSHVPSIPSLPLLLPASSRPLSVLHQFFPGCVQSAQPCCHGGKDACHSWSWPVSFLGSLELHFFGRGPVKPKWGPGGRGPAKPKWGPGGRGRLRPDVCQSEGGLIRTS